MTVYRVPWFFVVCKRSPPSGFQELPIWVCLVGDAFHFGFLKKNGTLLGAIPANTSQLRTP